MERKTAVSLNVAAQNVVRVFETDRELRRFLVEHPITGRLAWGMIRRIVDVARMFSDGRPDWTRFGRLCSEISLIGKWFPATSPAGSITRQSEIDNEATRLSQLGWSFAMVGEYLKALGKKRRGRPATRKHLAVTVLEKRETTKNNLTWWKAAREFCNCGLGRDHNNKSPCGAIIRQEVIRLKRFMRQHDL